MQLLNATRDALLRPLQIVSGIVERRHTMPILANVLIKKQGERLTFLATDSEVQISTSAVLGGSEENIATTVAARKLLDIVRALSETSNVALQLDGRRMTVAAGKSRFALQTLDADAFPVVAPAENYSASVTLPQKTLKHLFSMVHFSMAQQDIRYYLNGLLLVLDGEYVMAVATDGHRLAFCQVKTEEQFERQEVIIPRKTVGELQRLLEELDDPVQIDLAQSQIRLRFSDIELVSKLVEGKFPDFNRVIPRGYGNHFTLDRAVLQHSLQRAAIMTSDKFKGVRCMIEPGVMKISSTNADQEEALEEIEIDYGGASLDLGFNVSYLLEVLGNLKTEQVQFSFGDSSSSALVTIPNDGDFKYVVMPMRI
ncbi:DNA polymerase III subunit beta [Massilia sp. W12]|uniref:DNA polymerase III subunit beta n=1 Tax=Massilia sp. W12 TaxID=3126507 RepID=UPI0030CEC037